MSKKWKTIKNDTDSLIEIAYKAKYNSIECPPQEEVWLNIKNNLIKKQKHSLRRKGLVAAALLLIFTTFFILPSQTSVSAFANKIIKSIITFTEDTFTIHKKVGMSEVNDFTDLKFEDPRLEETQRKIHFGLSVPKYMPKDYYLDKIEVANKNPKHEIVALIYTVNEETTPKKIITITQDYMNDGTVASFNVVKEPDTVMKEIKIKDTEYLMFIFGNGYSEILWDKGNISYMILGPLSEDELIKIAESMR
jgi:hypothetical protein